MVSFEAIHEVSPGKLPVKSLDKDTEIDSDRKQTVVRAAPPERIFAPHSARRNSTGSSSSSRHRTSAREFRVHGRTGRHCVPHPLKASTGGEDAYTVVTGVNGTLTAVLDGVGGWAHVGVDSGLYSRTLAQQIKTEFLAWDQNSCPAVSSPRSPRPLSPTSCPSSSKFSDTKPLLEILERAYAHVSDLGLEGSCTICMSLLFASGKLHTLNLGDSGLRIVREENIVFATVEQQHSFNFPSQLGLGSKDVPESGSYHVTKVLPGDTIIIASDGVWDNLWDQEILGLVRDGVGTCKGCSAGLDGLARSVVEAAHRRGADTAYYSPFAHNAKDAGIAGVNGGKLDDTTAVIVRVCKRAGIM